MSPAPNDGQEPFVISMPPPNLTGALHYGHAVIVTYEDIMIRWRRMQGRPTLWLPGTDHAAIGTNTVLMNQLAQQGRTRDDLGRDGFEQLFWDWIGKSGGTIRTQIRRLELAATGPESGSRWMRDCLGPLTKPLCVFTKRA